MSIPSDKLSWLGIDFDGVLCHSEPPDYEPEYPLKGAVDGMRRLHDLGWKLHIFTARPWFDYQKVEDWLNLHDVPFRRIICGKPLFFRLIDDRNIEFTNWEEAVEKVIQAKQ
jgi:hypothetical protein